MRSPSPWVVLGLYVTAAAFAITPLVEVFTTVWPLRPADPMWRYGALGVAGTHLHRVVLGVALLVLIAYWQEHRGALRGLGWLCLVAALSMLPAMALFGLDVLQIRGLRAEELRTATLVAGAIQEVKYLAAAAALTFLGVGSLRTAENVARAPKAAAAVGPGIVKAARGG